MVNSRTLMDVLEELIKVTEDYHELSNINIQLHKALDISIDRTKNQAKQITALERKVITMQTNCDKLFNSQSAAETELFEANKKLQARIKELESELSKQIA